MNLKYTVSILIFLFTLGLFFLYPKIELVTDSDIKPEIKEEQNVAPKSEPSDIDEMDFSDLNIKSKAEGYIPPENLNKKVLDLIDDTKRNQEELLALDILINKKINFILKTKNLKKDEKHRIKYESEDGNIKITIVYTDKNVDQIRFMAYEDNEKSLRYVSSKNYFGKEADIFKERIVTFYSKDNEKFGNPDVSIIVNNGSFEKYLVLPFEDLDDVYVYDVVNDKIQIPRFDAVAKNYTYYSYDYKGNLIR